MPRLGQVISLEQLGEAAKARKAVICTGVPCFGKPKSAAFVINMQGHQLLRVFKAGLYIYEKPTIEGA